MRKVRPTPTLNPTKSCLPKKKLPVKWYKSAQLSEKLQMRLLTHKTTRRLITTMRNTTRRNQERPTRMSMSWRQ